MRQQNPPSAFLLTIAVVFLACLAAPYGCGTLPDPGPVNQAPGTGLQAPVPSRPKPAPTSAPSRPAATPPAATPADTATVIDETAPGILTTLGIFMGMPGVGVAAAALWRRFKPARAFVDVVRSVQTGRASLKALGDPGVLKQFDLCMSNQYPATSRLVKRVKTKTGIISITKAIAEC